MAEFSHSRAAYAKKLSNGYVATNKAVYDDVFGGPPKFARPTRVEDYSEIFGSYHSSRGSSIPILDLPVVEDELVDVRSSKFDYKEVFGRFDCVDFAVPYEELFSAEEDRGVGGAVESSSSSEDAWTPAETGSPSEGSCEKPTCLENKKACTNGELLDAYHDVKLFNMSYHKTNQISKEDGISGTTHIARLNAVPAYTFVVDEDIPLQSEKFGKSSSQEVNDNQSVNSNGVVEGKEFRKTTSQESASDAPLRNSSGIMEEKNFNKIFSDEPACGTFTKTATSDVKPQSNLCENGTFPRKGFVSVIDINLRTQPTHVPPPERPPPKLTIKQGDSKTSNLKDSTGNAQEGVRGDDSPSFFDVEVDASSSAAASAAAMKLAMEKAQARLKSAKESMERKRDGLQNRKKMGLKEEIKRKERKQGEIVEEIKGDKFHNNIETEEIELNGFDRDQRQREKTRDLNDSQESKGTMYVKGYRSTQHSGEQKRPGEWKAEEQFYELAKKEKCETFGREQNEKTATKVAFEQQEENYVKLQTAARMAQSEEDGKKHKEAHVLQESENKVREAFEREHEKKFKEARELEEYENKLKEAREQQEQEKKLREAREQQEQENKLREARKQQEQERKHKEAREQQEQDRKLKEAREQQEQERKLKKSREMVEYEKKLKQAQEREEHEKKLKESQEQKENELKQKEARQREENNKRQKEASEREENEKRLKESREFEEYAKKLKEVQELEESKIKQKQVHEENDRRLKEQEENEKRLKEALQQAKVACEREENEKKLRELQEQKELSEACKKEETEKRENEACEKEENKKRQHKQVWEKEDHDEIEVSQEFFGCNQGEQNLIALKISRDIAESENKIKVDDDTFIQDVDTNSKVTNAASDQEENCKKLNVLQESCENENMMETANYASPGKENKELKVASGQDGRERLTNTCMAQNFPEHKGFENKEEVNHDIKEEKLKEPEEVMEQEKTDKCKKAEQVAFDFEDNKSNHRTVQGEKQQVANGKKMEAAYPVSDLEEKRSKPKMSNELDTKKNTERKEKIFNEKFIREEREKEERLSREREQEKECLRKIEEEKERAREREKDRMAVERATREVRERAYAEVRERAERAAVERATAEVRQRALSEARERLERASAEAREKSLAERASVEARLRAERAAVDRATAEARERAEKAMAEKAAFEARERAERSVSEKFSGTSRDNGMRHSASFSDLRHPTYRSSNSFSGPLRFSNSSNYSASANEKSQASEVESAQRCKARLERHQRTVERAAKALAEKNKRDVQAQREQAERNRLAETLDADVKRWSSGKEGNLRALLSTLQYILGPESGWQPVPLTDVITAVAVKKAYRKATLCVHPDKLQQRGANIQQKYICGKVFDLLKEAWNKFNSEER